ncbi:MAG: hypothetical protein Q4E36_05625 [Bacillota bacterium]|nr:hypothetical protein [Bacillota bacterium]
MKYGTELLCSGNGFEFREDIEEEEDMFFVEYQGKPMMIPISYIEYEILIEGN